MTTLTNDQITAGAAVLAIPTAILHLPCNRTMSHFATVHEMNSYKEGHRDARHAAADLVLERADELKALAASSPQVADIAELPVAGWARKRDDGTGFGNWLFQTKDGAEKHGAHGDGYNVVALVERDAIAASRRAAGGEDEPTKEMLAAGWGCMPSEEEKRSDMDYVYYIYKAMRRAALATTAPASAGQAKSGIPKRAWSKEAEMMESWAEVSAGQAAPEPLPDTRTVKMLREAADIMVELADKHRAVSQSSIAWMENYLPLIDAMEDAAAQPAEGAGHPKCHKCHGNSITHASFCPLFDRVKEQDAMQAYHAEQSVIEIAASIFDFKPHKQTEETKAKYLRFADAILARGAGQAGQVAKLADALNTMLWLYRRLPGAYGKPPFVDAALIDLAAIAGVDGVPEAIKERATLLDATQQPSAQVKP